IWLPVAILAAASMIAVSVLPREDIGSTVPAGGIAIVAGVVLLGGVVGPEWEWNPANLEATFHAPLVVGAVIGLAGRLVAGAAASIADSVLPREDIGSTVPAGGIAIVAVVVLLGGVVGLEWEWNPANLEATYHAPLVVGAVIGLAGLLVTWAAATASAGFGS